MYHRRRIRRGGRSRREGERNRDTDTQRQRNASAMNRITQAQIVSKMAINNFTTLNVIKMHCIHV